MHFLLNVANILRKLDYFVSSFIGPPNIAKCTVIKGKKDERGSFLARACLSRKQGGWVNKIWSEIVNNFLYFCKAILKGSNLSISGILTIYVDNKIKYIS